MIENQLRVDVVDKLYVDVVSGCQLKCVGCSNSLSKKTIKYMTIEDFKLALANLDIKHVVLMRLFIFGEPLLNKNLVEMISYIPNQKWSVDTVELSTNAMYYDEEQLIAIAKQKIVKNFAVSCDGNGTKEEFEKLRPPAKWEKLMHFLVNMKRIRDEYNPSMNLFTRNICPRRKDRRRWASILGPIGWKSEFRTWNLSPLSAQTLDNKEMREGLCYPMRDDDNLIFIDYDGTLMPCCLYPRPFVYGNILKQVYSETLSEKKKFQEMMKANKKGMSICNVCRSV